MIRFIDNFKSKLEGIDFETLEQSKYTIYGLSEDLELIYVNPGWVNFAKENGVSDSYMNDKLIGSSVINAIDGEKIKNFYTENYINVLKTKKPWKHEYECSSIQEYRQFHQNTYPLKNGKGLIVTNTLTVNLPMNSQNRKAYDALNKRYVANSGYITQCSNCRCTQRANEIDVWDWVPKWVENIPKNFSHSICPICFDYYWKK
ncbi:hypothetical protein [uncultured Polaribacter sp.]|uniref:hypothetical protein n=1 Tax=uncultured Polaribacter sp. TaxID=174711 RepID=UPI002630C6CC|nr:hypothetical protein [uncultured Polaribacter sp.]